METTVEERILLHLRSHLSNSKDLNPTYALSQQGIADAIGASLSQVSRVLREMKKEDLIDEKTKWLKHDRERKKKVYSLTHKGVEEEKKVRKRLESNTFILYTPEGEIKVSAHELDSYIGDINPLLYALTHIDNRGGVNTKQTMIEKKPPFIDRKKEISLLKDCLEDVHEKGCVAIFITGEAGAGKTTLVSEFKKHAVKKGFDVLSGRAHFETSEPYLPLRKALESYSGSKHDEGITRNPMDVITKKEARTDDKLYYDERHSVFFEFRNMIREKAKKTPLVISLDDLQWADTATLELLHYLIVNIHDAPVLLICTYRTEDIRSSHPLLKIRDRLYRQQRYNEITLEPFKIKHTRKLLYSITNNYQLNPNLVEQIHRITEGNPLFIKEFTELLIKEGQIQPDVPSFFIIEDLQEIPKVIEDVIVRRLTTHLTEEQRHLVEMGSVIGLEIPFELLLNCCETNELRLLNIIDELLYRNIWAEIPERDCFMFSHILIKMVAHRNISALKRKKLHLVVARQIKELYEDSINEYYSDIAYHYEMGGDKENAISYYLKATEEAESVFAHENAIEIYEKVLNLAGEEKVDILHILQKLGEIHKIIGEYEKSLEYFNMMTDIDDISKKLILLKGKSEIYACQGDYPRALETIEQSLSICDEKDRTICELLSSKGWLYLDMGAYNDAKKVFEDEMMMAGRVGGKHDMAQARHDLGTVDMQMGLYDSAKGTLKKALGLWDATEEISNMARTLNNIGIIYFYESDFNKALEYYERSLDIRMRTGEKRYMSILLHNIAIIHTMKGDFNKALTFNQRALDINRNIGYKAGIAMSLNEMGNIYYEKGEINLARDVIETSFNVRENIGDNRGVTQSLCSMGKIYRADNRLEKAIDILEKALHLCEEVGDKHIVVEIHLEMAKTYLESEKLDIALKHAERALEIGEQGQSIAFEGIVHMIFGMVHEKRGDLNEAKKEFVKSLEQLERIGGLGNSTKAMHNLGRIMVMQGATEKGKKYLDIALERFNEREMKLWARRCKDELANLT